jgi:hypothetical protein
MSELRAGDPVTVAGVTLIPIERLRISAEKQPYAYWLDATKDVYALVICDHQGPRAVDVEAKERPVDEFITEIPELETLLTQFLPP